MFGRQNRLVLWHDSELSPLDDANWYRIGLPAWAFPGWQGRYFHNRPSTLASYANVFNTVEGNTTFYQIPSRKMVAGWCDALVNCGFEICFKLPRTITHEPVANTGDLKVFF